MGSQGGVGRREPGPPTLSVATARGSSHLPWHSLSELGMGDLETQTPNPKEVLRVPAQGREIKSVLPTGSQGVQGHLSEEQKEEEEPAGEASGDAGTPERRHFAQALEVEREHLQRAMGPLDVSLEALARELEPEKECLLDRDLRLASFNGGSTPWNHLLTLYKQLQKSAMAKVREWGDGTPGWGLLPQVAGPTSWSVWVGRRLQAWGPYSPHLLRVLAHLQFPLMEDLPHEEEEEETKEEDSSLGLCVPGTAGLQSPLQKSFSPTDTVGFVQSELKNLLAVQRESRLWKVGSQEGRELLAQPEITLQEAGVVDGQHLLLEEMDEMGNWPPE
ncbi:Gametogenetin-binding protein 1 [Tupaia chinensis]|uniref:Gametogenetin-binding protein 1 n=1 Tax=Tupaia chinensis TaxID=246437 RepID=L9L307_TUPCH|nr:Gametogenetin-binding protein 1 [Tupaia chinensis]